MEDTERKGYGGVYDKAVLPSQAWAEGLCAECEALLRYSQARLDSCPFDGSKKSCRKCSIHCYSPEMREKIREVMRYSGPRMFFYSPFEAFRHI